MRGLLRDMPWRWYTKPIGDRSDVSVNRSALDARCPARHRPPGSFVKNRLPVPAGLASLFPGIKIGPVIATVAAILGVAGRELPLSLQIEQRALADTAVRAGGLRGRQDVVKCLDLVRHAACLPAPARVSDLRPWCNSGASTSDLLKPQ